MAGKERHATIDKLLSLKSPGDPQISPDGKQIAYTVQQTDWKEDLFVDQLWIADLETGRQFQLTWTARGAGGQQWSADGQWLAFLSERPDSAPGEDEVAAKQIWLISPSGGEAVRLTKSPTNIVDFRWAPDSRRLAFRGPPPEPRSLKERRNQFGDFEIVDRDIPMNRLWLVDIGSKRTRTIFAESNLSVGSYDWSPDGERLALELATDPRPKGWGTSDIYLLHLGDQSLRPLVVQPGPNYYPQWSPDGTHLAFTTAMGGEDFFYANQRLAVVAADGGAPVSQTDSFDESPNLIAWNTAGIFFQAYQGVHSHLFRLDPQAGTITRVSAPDQWLGRSFTFDKDGRTTAFISADAQHLPDIFVTLLNPFKPRRITTRV